MQCTKPDGLKWNTIFNLFLYSLGFAKNVIDHALYSLNKTLTMFSNSWMLHTWLPMCLLQNPPIKILPCRDQQILSCDLQERSSNILSQSTHHPISIRHDHILDISYPGHHPFTRFPDTFDRFNFDPTPFTVDSTFELALSERISATTTKLHLL